MPTLNDLKPNECIVALIVGKAGSGKTSAIASFANKDNRMYIFDIDGRIRGLNGSKNWLTDNWDHIDYDNYTTRGGFKAIELKMQEFAIKYDKRELPYKNIVIESVGSLSEMFLVDSQTLKGYKPGSIDKSKGSGMRTLGNIAFPGPDDYNYGKRCFHILFYEYFQYFKKCNIFLSAWTTDKYIPDPNGNQYAPQVISGTQLLATNKIASELPGYWDEIWEFDKQETGMSKNPLEYTVKFRSSLAKTAIPELPNEIKITGKNFKQELDKIRNGNIK